MADNYYLLSERDREEFRLNTEFRKGRQRIFPRPQRRPRRAPQQRSSGSVSSSVVQDVYFAYLATEGVDQQIDGATITYDEVNQEIKVRPSEFTGHLLTYIPDNSDPTDIFEKTRRCLLDREVYGPGYNYGDGDEILIFNYYPDAYHYPPNSIAVGMARLTTIPGLEIINHSAPNGKAYELTVPPSCNAFFNLPQEEGS